MANTQGKADHKGAGITSALILAAAALLFVNSYWFQFSADGSFLMYRAGQLGLVSDAWAKDHLLDIVYFKKLPDGSWEYRVARPLVGYALIPGLVAKRTTKNLGALCQTPDANGNKGCLLTSLVGKP